jgi:hypothetical protein
MTPERWKEYDRAYDAWSKRYRAFVDGEVASGQQLPEVEPIVA